MSTSAEIGSDLFILPGQGPQKRIPQSQDLVGRMICEALEGTLPKSLQPQLCACLGELAMQRSA